MHWLLCIDKHKHKQCGGAQEWRSHFEAENNFFCFLMQIILCPNSNILDFEKYANVLPRMIM